MKGKGGKARNGKLDVLITVPSACASLGITTDREMCAQIMSYMRPGIISSA